MSVEPGYVPVQLHGAERNRRQEQRLENSTKIYVTDYFPGGGNADSVRFENTIPSRSHVSAWLCPRSLVCQMNKWSEGIMQQIPLEFRLSIKTAKVH